jgi:hypothetical protein
MIPPLERLKGDFIIQTSETDQPRSMKQAFGYSLCCGFFAVFNNAATAKFMDMWLAKTGEGVDDQYALNQLVCMLTARKVYPKDCRCVHRHLSIDMDVLGLPSPMVTRDPHVVNAAFEPLTHVPWHRQAKFVSDICEQRCLFALPPSHHYPFVYHAAITNVPADQKLAAIEAVISN